MSTTLEVRQALPYVSHLKIVKFPNLQVVYGKDQQGNDAQGLMANQPSMQVEVTLYIVGSDGSTEKAFATPYTFGSRNYLHDILDQIAAIENPPQNVLATKKTIQDRLATEKLWLEDVLAAAGIPTLEGLWSDAFSASMDEFPTWAESATPIGGVKTYIRQLEWDARLSYEANKTVTVTMGIYSTPECKETQPERKILTFEDGASKRQRQANIAALDQRITQLAEAQTAIDAIKAAKAMPAGAQRDAILAQFNPQIVNQPDLDAYRAQVVQEQSSYVNQKAQLAAVTYGEIKDLVSLTSIAGSIKSLVVDGVLANLKAVLPEWSDLDMNIVSSRFALPPVE